MLVVPMVLWAGGRADQVAQGTALRLRAGTGLIPLSSLVTEGILLGGWKRRAFKTENCSGLTLRSIESLEADFSCKAKASGQGEGGSKTSLGSFTIKVLWSWKLGVLPWSLLKGILACCTVSLILPPQSLNMFDCFPLKWKPSIL